MATNPKPTPINRALGDPLSVGKIVDKEEIIYKVVPGHRHAKRGETLVFKYSDDITTLEIEGEIFDSCDYSTPGEARATLRDDLVIRRFYPYRVICDRTHEAEGGTPPTVIIDG